MGCSSSKQKEEKLRKNYEVLPEPSVKQPKQIKAKRTKKEGSVIDAVPNDSNDTKVRVQRSITPPPAQTVKKPKVDTKSKPKSKTTRKTWTDEELLCQLKFLDHDTSSNIVRLFDEGNTIPFMCRYRRELIGNRDADEWVFLILFDFFTIFF